MSNQNTKEALVELGKIGTTYGVHGWLKVQSYTENWLDLLNYSPWYLALSEAEVYATTSLTVSIEEGRIHGKGLIVKLKGYNTPEIARQLTGKIIYIKKTQLPALKEQEYYWSDLTGLSVINQRGENLGKVIHVMETGSNDVLVVKGEKEVAIPYLPGQVILRVDLEQQTIYVAWELL